MIKKLWCFIKGHDAVEVGTINNGQSVIRQYECLRCGNSYTLQYDYSV